VAKKYNSFSFNLNKRLATWIYRPWCSKYETWGSEILAKSSNPRRRHWYSRVGSTEVFGHCDLIGEGKNGRGVGAQDGRLSSEYSTAVDGGTSYSSIWSLAREWPAGVYSVALTQGIVSGCGDAF